MNLDKDTYEYILNFLDDKDIVNMLSVNRKFNNEKLYERVLRKKYPLLVKFKKENEKETSRHLFLRMIKYISLIIEKYDIPYIPLQDYDPEDFYKSFKRDHTDTLKIITIMLMREKAENNESFLFILQKLQEQIKDSFYIVFALNNLAQYATEIGNLEKLKILLEKGADDYYSLFLSAAGAGNMQILQFIQGKVASPTWIIERSINLARSRKHFHILPHLLSLKN